MSEAEVLGDLPRSISPTTPRSLSTYSCLVARLGFFSYRFDRMCGRFTLRSRDRIGLKGVRNFDLPFEARYNIAPSQSVVAVGDFGSGPEITCLTWGLIPSWSAEAKAFINARGKRSRISQVSATPFDADV